jgi:hypothetical protein
MYFKMTYSVHFDIVFEIRLLFELQGDYKLCQRLHNLVSNKVSAKEK